MKWSLAVAALALAWSGQAQDKAGFRFDMKQRPEVRVGDWLQVDLRARVQLDFREFSDSRQSEDFFDPRRARVGVEGRLFHDLDFEVDYELLPDDHHLRDAFLNYRRLRGARLQVGQFKVPFGMDQLTSIGNLEFIYRSRIGSQLTPGRDQGLMLHGSLAESGFQYQVGVFRHDGQVAETLQDAPTGGRTAAARIVVAPLHLLGVASFLRKVETGAAMTRSDVAEGMSGPRGRTIAGDTYFDRMFVRGARTRKGLEASVPIGSLMLKGEFINMRQQRREQSLRETDLPDLIARGWYASATYPILGKKRNRRGRGFFRSLIPGTSLGLVEAAARYEQIRFGSRGAGGLPPSRSTRAANVPRNSDRAATFGVNWESSRYSRLQFNVIREALEDAVRFPVNGTKMYWTYTGRIQFGF